MKRHHRDLVGRYTLTGGTIRRPDRRVPLLIAAIVFLNMAVWGARQLLG